MAVLGFLKRLRWRRILLIAVTALAVLISPAVGGVIAAFQVIQLPAEVRKSQASVLYYSDGVTELTRVGVENRTYAPLADVPPQVRHAVLAAEDRGFYEHGALSWTGVARALISNVTSDDTQGASTITQQFVKNAYLGQERTLDRKAREAVLSIKAERRYSKDQILEGYLNTIYFGRGAYGIDAAAKIYFGVRTRDLTVAQGAVLAANIKSPTGYDPVKNRKACEERWRYLIRSMTDAGWLTSAEAARARFPAIEPERSTLTGPGGYVVALAEREVAQQGITEQQLRTQGLKIVTTIDKRAQDAAESAMNTALAGLAPATRGSLVAVQPGTGAIRAYYGGNQGYGFFDYAQGSYPSAGMLEPYIWAEVLPGRAPFGLRQIPDAEAHAKMLAAFADRVDPARVTLAASQAGIRRSASGDRDLARRDKHESPVAALGRYPATPTDLAAGLATIASGGTHVTPFLVQSVSQGEVELWRASPKADRVPGPLGRPGVAAAIGNTLGEAVPLASKRPARSIAGALRYRQDGVSSVGWTTGFTPGLASAVWLGMDKPAPLVGKTGKPADAAATTGAAWSAFLDKALEGTPAQKFPQPEPPGPVPLPLPTGR